MKPYFDKVHEAGITDLHALLLHANQQLLNSMYQVPTNAVSWNYQPGKWSIAELLQHILDTDKIFAHRAFCISRSEKAALPSFDKDAYIQNSYTAQKDFSLLLQEYVSHHQYMLTFFNNLTPHEFTIKGRTTEYEITPLVLGYAIAGHKLHHVQILHERYLPKLLK